MIQEIKDYIDSFDDNIKDRLLVIHNTIETLIPNATQKISYGMPTFYIKENLIHYAGYKNHIGIYPTPEGIERFLDEIKIYKNAKGSFQIPHDKDLPLDLIKRITLFKLDYINNKYLKNK